jgi:hypothetical protein
MHLVPSLLCLAAATLVIGCAETPRAVQPPAATVAERMARASTTTTPRPVRRGVTVRAVRSRYGTILANGAGKAFYLFDKERTSRADGRWLVVQPNGRPVL